MGPRPPENDIAPTIPRGAYGSVVEIFVGSYDYSYYSYMCVGEACYAGGGYAGDWCFLCTNYYYSNASSSDPKNVSDLKHKVTRAVHAVINSSNIFVIMSIYVIGGARRLEFSFGCI